MFATRDSLSGASIKHGVPALCQFYHQVFGGDSTRGGCIDHRGIDIVHLVEYLLLHFLTRAPAAGQSACADTPAYSPTALLTAAIARHPTSLRHLLRARRRHHQAPSADGH